MNDVMARIMKLRNNLGSSSADEYKEKIRELVSEVEVLLDVWESDNLGEMSGNFLAASKEVKSELDSAEDIEMVENCLRGYLDLLAEHGMIGESKELGMKLSAILPKREAESSGEHRGGSVLELDFRKKR